MLQVCARHCMMLPRPARDFLLLQCWSVLHLGHVFPGGPSAGWSVIFSCVAMGSCSNDREAGEPLGRDPGGAAEGFRALCKSVQVCSKEVSQVLTLPTSQPGLSGVTWLYSDTGQHQAAQQPQTAAGSCLPRETTLCPVSRTHGREHLWGGDSSTSETHHKPTQPSLGGSGQTHPCNFHMLSKAALGCSVPWLVLTLQSERGQETLSSWSGSQLVPL